MLDVVIVVRTSVGAGVGSTVGCGDGGDVITAVGACHEMSDTIKKLYRTSMKIKATRQVFKTPFNMYIYF
jgi:hypothetical protein